MATDTATSAEMEISSPAVDNSDDQQGDSATRAPKPPRLRRNAISNTHTEYQAIFKSVEEYRAFKARQGLNQDDARYSQCPQSDADKMRYVKILFEAIRDTSNAVDKKMINGNLARPVQMSIDGHWPDNIVEELCWDIIELLNKSYCGIKLLDAHCIRKKKVFDSYDEQFNAIVEACRTYKSICKSLLDDKFIYRLVDNPHVELKRKEGNQATNIKQETLSLIGRESLKRGMKADEVRQLYGKGEMISSFANNKRKRDQDSSSSDVNNSSKRRKGSALETVEQLFYQIVCNLLGIDVQDAIQGGYSIQQLRTYAKAYIADEEYNQYLWRPLDWNPENGLFDKYQIRDCLGQDVIYNHLSKALPIYLFLANLRGDIDMRGNVAPNQKMIFLKDYEHSDLVKKALGLVTSEIGGPEWAWIKVVQEA